MRLDRVDAHADELGAAGREVVLAPGELAELRGAHRGEVGGMRKQDAPAVAEVVVQAESPFGGLRREVRGGVAQLDGHRDLSSLS
jgi:hypothetical protein